MEKILPQKPVLILLYGFPGSGKTYFSRQFSQEVQAAHLEEDRIRSELFEQPRFTKQENYALSRIMEYMAGEFLSAGISVIYDTNAMRIAQRRNLRELARKHKAEVITVWFQVDPDTAFVRNAKRDRRKLDDRFAAGYNADSFRELASHMQHPESTEDFLVISGKHSFPSQLSSTIKKLADLHIVKHDAATRKMVKPELVNLVASHQPQKENGRHNIVLR